MLCKDDGVVLSSTRRGDSSKLVTFLGRSSGKVRLLAKGALGPKSPFRGALEPGSVIEVLFYHKDARSLYFLKEVSVRSSVDAHRGALARMATVLAALELIDQVSYWGHSDAPAVDLACEFLEAREVADPLLFLLAFEYKMLDVLGTLPDVAHCAQCASPAGDGYYFPEDGTSACATHAGPSPHRIHLDDAVLAELSLWCASRLAELAPRGVEPAVRKRLGKILHWTYTFHINGYSLPEALKLIPRGN